MESKKPKSALFVCYEDLCTDELVWSRLAAHADIPANDRTGDVFELSSRPVDTVVDQGLADRATAIYTRLQTQARAQPY